MCILTDVSDDFTASIIRAVFVAGSRIKGPVEKGCEIRGFHGCEEADVLPWCDTV
jgi:hypothetical protein